MKQMKYMQIFATAGILVGIAVCASAPRVAVQEPVGPCHRVASPAATDSVLVVYSARRPADVDLNVQELLWNNDFGQNEFMYEPAHTDYTIYTSDGQVFKRVSNASGRNDGIPASVSLPAGIYTVEAEAERQGTLTMTVQIPVVVEAGQTTMVHLEPTWERRAALKEAGNWVRLFDGRVIGCRADARTEPQAAQR